MTERETLPLPPGEGRGEGELPERNAPAPRLGESPAATYPLPKREGFQIGSSTVTVRAPCRLHFGMFGFGHADRPQYGGVGVMIDAPAVEVEISPAARFDVDGSHGERAAHFARLAATAWHLPALPSCCIHITAPSDHIGLGVGTQLGLSIAAGLRRFLNLPHVAVEELAQSVGRASRSAVGTHGFQHGGLIVDAGRHAVEALGKLLHRARLPDSWRFVLVRPVGQSGLAGPVEADAFARLPPVPQSVTQELWHITNDQMLPALEGGDCEAFGESVYRFGRMAGECFAPVQGGTFASREIARLVNAIRSRGIRGVGQSSWGPTVFAVCESHADAQFLCEWLQRQSRAGHDEVTIARPNSEGAVIR